MATFTQAISNTANDLHSFGAALVDLVQFGNDNPTIRDAYLRFTGLTVPKGATVSAATIDWRAAGTLSTASCNVKIGFSNEDSATIPSTPGDASGRSFTASPTSWTVPAYTISTLYTTADFAPSAQELFARSGWASGNNALVMVRNNSSTAGAYRYVYDKSEAAGAFPASLSITYTAPASGGAKRLNRRCRRQGIH